MPKDPKAPEEKTSPKTRAKKKNAGGEERVPPGTRTAKQEEHLFPPRPAQFERALAAFEHPESDRAYAELLESICGAADDSQPVEQYNGTLGVTVAFVNANQRPVGQVQWNNNLGSIYTNPGNVSGVRWGSGTLLANNLFLTAGHLFDQTADGWTLPRQNGTTNTISSVEIASRMHVNFNYQVNPAGVLRTEQQFPILQLVEFRLGGLDFAVVRLGGNPVGTFGTALLSATNPAQNETICIMGHPAGVPKRIEAGTVFSIGGNAIRYDNIDTLGGNSGSGILRASTGRVVGVHTNGGCNAAGTGQNRGFPIAAILAASPTLRGILNAPKAPIDDIATTFGRDVGQTTVLADITKRPIDDIATTFGADVGNTLKFSDDRPSVKFLDDGGRTLKSVDDAKLPGLDKQFSDVKLPGADGVLVNPGTPITQPGIFAGGGGARPFVLANPHHSMAWAGGESQAQHVQAQYEATLVQLQQLLQQGEAELAAMQQRYQQLAAEYDALMTPQQQQ